MRFAPTWPLRRRVALAGCVGLVYAVLMVGLIGLDQPPLVLLAANALLAGPTLGVLARSWWGLAGIVGLAVAVAASANVMLAWTFSGRPWSELDYAALTATLVLNWIPALLVAPLVYFSAVRRAKGAREAASQR